MILKSTWTNFDVPWVVSQPASPLSLQLTPMAIGLA